MSDMNNMSMKKIFNGFKIGVIVFLLLFFMIAPKDVSNVESKVIPIEKKSVEITKQIETLDKEISFLKEDNLKKQAMIQELLDYLKTKKGKKYVERLSIK